MISKAELEKVVGSKAAERFHGPLNDAFAEFHVDTPLRVAAFVAQAMHESLCFTVLRENLNYSAKGLLATFPKHFTAEQAAKYEHQPERIANRVYANRDGNGDEASGDGWKFRGGGLFQETGLQGYFDCSQALFGDGRLVNNPELIEDPLTACRAAAWFWSKNKLNQLADQEDMKGITRKVSGGYNGLKERQDNYAKVLTAFGG
jgi:putative chitinase